MPSVSSLHLCSVDIAEALYCEEPCGRQGRSGREMEWKKGEEIVEGGGGSVSSGVQELKKSLAGGMI